VSPNFVRATNERQAYKLSKCEHHISQHTDIGSSREMLKLSAQVKKTLKISISIETEFGDKDDVGERIESIV